MIYCCGCQKEVEPSLTNGSEVYPHRPDLYDLPFWKCDECKNYVGCHHKTKDRTKPLGCIPTTELKRARMEVHKILDPIWKSGKMSRTKIYGLISEYIGWKYHTAGIRSVEEARSICKFLRSFYEKV